MKCLHVMLSRGLGGIEQVFLDHTAMLRAEGWKVVPVLHPHSALLPKMRTHRTLPNAGFWDPLAMWRLKKMIEAEKPNVILTHGSRALSLAKRVHGKTPLCPMAHNYWLKGFHDLPHAIAITADVAEKLREQGVTQVEVIPNVVHPPKHPANPEKLLNTPPVIGAMGRFVAKKGFDHFIAALAQLKQQGIAFTAKLGGSGEEEASLQALARTLGLTQAELEFTGWVEDKTAFFSGLDLFCLPSRSEPFGIVLLEAFAHGVPVISTRSEGPSTIATEGKDVLFAEGPNFAAAIQKLLQDPRQRKKISQGGLETAARYAPSIIGPKLSQFLKTLCK